MRCARAIAVVTLVAALLSCCGTVVTGRPAGVEGTQYARPGLPPIGPGLADGGGLRSEPGGQAVAYHGVPVIQACSLVTPQDVAGLGLALIPDSDPGLDENSYLDGTGEVAPYTISPLGGPNYCLLHLGREGAVSLISLAVHQPAYATAKKIAQTIEFDFGAGADRRGVTVYAAQRPDATYVEHWLSYRDVHVDLTVGMQDHRLDEVVLDAVVDRLRAQVAAPTGPPRFDHDSPAFPAPAVSACAVSAWADVHSLTTDAPGSWVKEMLSPGIGRTIFGNGLVSNHVANGCMRHGGRSSDGPVDWTRVTTYDSIDGARGALASHRRVAAGTDTAERIGDESLVLTLFGHQWLAFRRGRAVVEIEYEALDSGPPPADIGRALLPVARAVAARVPAD